MERKVEEGSGNRGGEVGRKAKEEGRREGKGWGGWGKAKEEGEERRGGKRVGEGQRRKREAEG